MWSTANRARRNDAGAIPGRKGPRLHRVFLAMGRNLSKKSEADRSQPRMLAQRSAEAYCWRVAPQQSPFPLRLPVANVTINCEKHPHQTFCLYLCAVNPIRETSRAVNPFRDKTAKLSTRFRRTIKLVSTNLVNRSQICQVFLGKDNVFWGCLKFFIEIVPCFGTLLPVLCIVKQN